MFEPKSDESLKNITYSIVYGKIVTTFIRVIKMFKVIFSFLNVLILNKYQLMA